MERPVPTRGRAPDGAGPTPFRALELARALGGELVGADEVVRGLAIDSRTLRPGQLFAAIRAERDGHDFVAAAVDAGAAACLVERPVGSGPCVVVPDVPAALQDLARLVRDRLGAADLGDRVVGITGSVGKTTTKDLLAGVLATTYRTAASERSFNNELGVPLTLANAPADTEAAVIEMGARGAGHIGLLCSMARPSIGVVTVVASVHTEHMGGLGAIAEAKRELVESLPATGLAVLNADDERVAAMAGHTAAEVLTFGDSGQVRAVDVAVDAELRATFRLESPWGTVPVQLGVRGAHNVANALAAAAPALWLGVTPERVASGLATAPASPWRMELVRTEDGPVVLNDAYNAGPASMAVALRALSSLDAQRRIAVLGVMAELGDDAVAEHRRIAELAADLGIELVAVGCDLYGVEPLDGPEAAVAALAGLGPEAAVLVKGSRVAGLEAVAAGLGA
jgi:UDP-N-acetylmuramoyl-tripeptide--D-alanyl-D-alanine ligase